MFKFIIDTIKQVKADRANRIAEHKAAHDQSLAYNTEETRKELNKQESKWETLRDLERQWESRYGFAKYQ